MMPMKTVQFSFAVSLILVLALSIFPFRYSNSPDSQIAVHAQFLSDSVIQNSGFEQGLTGWTVVGSPLIAATDEKVHSGNYSLKMSSSIPEIAYFYQSIDFPSTSYEFSFWLFRAELESNTECHLARDWDSNRIRCSSSLVIKDYMIILDAWDSAYYPGRQWLSYNVTAGIWHKITFVANDTSMTQEFYIDGTLIEKLNSSSGNVFNPDILMFGDVSNEGGYGTFYFDDFEIKALGTNTAPLRKPTLTTSFSKTTTSTGLQVEIRGSLSYDDLGLPEIPISILYSADLGSSWRNLTSVSTDADGNFFAVWQPDVAGEFLIMSRWTGNQTFADVSTVVSFAVAPATVQDLRAGTVFSVVSNSTVSDLFFNSTNQELSFSVLGSSNTTGYVDVYLSKSLVADISVVKAYLDGSLVEYTSTDAGDSWLLHFAYHHSVHTILVDLSMEETDSPLGITTLEAFAIGVIGGIAAITAIVFLRKRNGARAEK